MQTSTILSGFNSFSPVSISQILMEAKRLGIDVRIGVISGGPLAGKTTGLVHWQFEMMQRGWFVVIVPEAATIVRGSGFKAETGVISNYDAQRMMLETGEFLMAQSLIYAIRSGQKKILILRDRSAIDAAAYMSSYDEFDTLVGECRVKMSDLLIGDAHIFLQSLAVDNQELYNQLCSNNTARMENAHEAFLANNRTIRAYAHYNVPLRIIGNDYPTVDDKMRAALNVILEAVEQPRIQTQRAFIVKGDALEIVKKFEKYRTIDICQKYYENNRYRRTCFGENDCVFTRTRKRDTSVCGSRYEESEYIAAQEYYQVQFGNDLILKQRFATMDDNDREAPRLVKIDHFREPKWGDKQCRVEVDESTGNTDIPWFLKEHECHEVTGQDLYSNEKIAIGMTPMHFE